MKAILTRKGYEVCHHVTMGKIYEVHTGSAGHAWFHNDNGTLQEFLCDVNDKYLEVPEGYHVVKAKSAPHQSTYSWRAGDYLVVHEHPITDTQYETLHQVCPCVMKSDTELVMDSTGAFEVTIPKYVVLDSPVDNLTVGMHYEVESINISGSYMVKREYGSTIVSPTKCYPWTEGNSETKTVKCRCATFGQMQPPVAPPVAPKAPVGDSGKRAAPPKLVPDELTSENKKIIKKQKALAEELLERLSFYGNAIIAGGAPRNWWFNRPANDLDIFIPAPMGFTGTNLRAIMEREGITDIYNMATHNPDGTLKAKQPRGKSSYDDRMTDIHSVFEGRYCGQQVQVIWINVSTYGYIESHFDTSINMIFSVMHCGELDICPTREFNQGVKTGTIYVHDNQAAYSNAHLEKVANYFPGVPLVWYSEISECVKNPSYVWEVAKSWEDHLQYQMDEEQSEFDCW